MKKLLNISIKVWAAVAITISGAIIMLIVLLKMNVESTYKTNVVVDRTGHSDLIVDSKAAYLLKEKDKVVLRINGKDVEGIMKSITYDEKAEHFVAHLTGIEKVMIPSTTVPVQIIYDHTTVWNALITPGV